MAFNPNAAPTFQRELIPEGAHAARCSRIIELGEQESKSNPQYGIKKKAVIAFIVPDTTIEINGEEKYAFISKPYGITMTSDDRGTMRQYVRALAPQCTDMGEFLNKTCQIYVKHKERQDGTMKHDIEAVSPLLGDIVVPELDVEPFWFEWDNPKEEYWRMIPDFQKEMIMEAVNYPGSKVEEMVMNLGSDPEPLEDDELPF